MANDAEIFQGADLRQRVLDLARGSPASGSARPPQGTRQIRHAHWLEDGVGSSDPHLEASRFRCRNRAARARDDQELGGQNLPVRNEGVSKLADLMGTKRAQTTSKAQ